MLNDAHTSRSSKSNTDDVITESAKPSLEQVGKVAQRIKNAKIVCAIGIVPMDERRLMN